MLFALMAYFSFFLLDAVQKTAVTYHSVFQILFIKYCFVLILSLVESKRKKNYKVHIATKTFQALRILVNKEISELINGLINSVKILKTGGVLAVVTFH